MGGWMGGWVGGWVDGWVVILSPAETDKVFFDGKDVSAHVRVFETPKYVRRQQLEINH